MAIGRRRSKWLLSGGMNASRSRMRLRRCASRTGFEFLDPLGKNTQGPKRGLAYFGGEGGNNHLSEDIRGSPKLF